MVETKLAPDDHAIVQRQGRRLVELRHARGLTQARLAKGICTQAALSNYEHGIRQLPILVAMRLADRLDVTIEDLTAA